MVELTSLAVAENARLWAAPDNALRAANIMWIWVCCRKGGWGIEDMGKSDGWTGGKEE